MIVEQFNGAHFLLWGLTLGAVVLVCLVFGVFLRNKGKWVSLTAIIVLMAAGLILHFLRLPFPPPGEQWPYTIRFITPTSICAVNTLIFPIIFFTKSKVLKDYMFYLGVLGGFLFLITPLDIINRGLSAGSWEAIRYFAAHGILCAVSVLMVLGGHHKLSWKRCWTTCFVLVGVLVIILVNEIILMVTGVVEQDIAGLLDREYNNTAMIFGPPESSGIYSQVFDALTPNFLKTAPFDIGNSIMKGDTLYWPIIWMIVPGFLSITLLSLLLCFLFNFPYKKKSMKINQL